MLPQRRTSNHVFATLTFSRDLSCEDTWKLANRRFNRFITYYRRIHRDGCEYLRTIEAHADGYPHFHVILQHKSSLWVENGRYFDTQLYQKWKSLWLGNSDFQVPSSKTTNAVLYIIKYISKDSSKKTIWRKLFASVNAQDVTKNSLSNQTQPKSSVIPVSPTKQNTTISDHKSDQTLLFCKQFKIKQVTWSRKFIFPQIQRALSNRPLVTL